MQQYYLSLPFFCSACGVRLRGGAHLSGQDRRRRVRYCHGTAPHDPRHLHQSYQGSLQPKVQGFQGADRSAKILAQGWRSENIDKYQAWLSPLENCAW